MLTVDPHLHRVPTLDAVMPGCQGVALSAAPLLGRFVAAQRPGALLLAPDGEAEQWRPAPARPPGLAHAVRHKERHGDRGRLPCRTASTAAGPRRGAAGRRGQHRRHAALAARLALASAPPSVDVAVTHALFVGEAEARVRAAGVGSDLEQRPRAPPQQCGGGGAAAGAGPAQLSRMALPRTSCATRWM
ncbi:MAG: hypothetical protein U1E77_02750 [Inhella sp.]